MERFAGILIEHHAGRFPLWLAPLQGLVLPVADRSNEYAAQVAERLAQSGIRCRVDSRTESVGKKIRDAELARAPYMLVVGDREREADAASVRHHGDGDLGAMPVAELVERMRGEIDAR
jgi:threonyl-tRNA synthetase